LDSFDTAASGAQESVDWVLLYYVGERGAAYERGCILEKHLAEGARGV